MKAFLQFGTDKGPFQTVEVEVKLNLLPWQEMGLQESATGYGAQLTSCYMVKWLGKWRRVYVACFGNAASHYIGKPGNWIATVDIWES